MSIVTSRVAVGERKLPLTIQFDEGSDIETFAAWHADNKELVAEALLSIGAIHFRGIHSDTVEKFDRLSKYLSPEQKSFLDGNSPRGKYTSNVYNASEYDANSIIRLHTEYSYSNIWPAYLFFCCITPAKTGGQTTVGDCRVMIDKLNPDLVEEFERKGITYIRNLHAGNGLGPSWMDAFETRDKAFLEDYCARNSIELYWQKDGSVRLVQTRPAIRVHEQTGDRLWFNQVDQFYPGIYGEEVYETLLMMAGNDEEALPMFSRYGDGTPIQKEYVEEIVRVLDEVLIPVPWEKGDLLIVDNMIALHGRLPFTGDRKILVSMA
jgi:hypothetical protein